MSQENHRHEQADHVREAVAEHLEDLEDRFTADFGSADTPVQDLIEYMKTLNAEN